MIKMLTWFQVNPDAHAIGSPTDGPGEKGKFTKEDGYLAYYEVSNIKNVFTNLTKYTRYGWTCGSWEVLRTEWFVVYFDQRFGAAHSKRWLK